MHTTSSRERIKLRKLRHRFRLLPSRGLIWFLITAIGEFPKFGQVLACIAKVVAPNMSLITYLNLSGIHTNQMWPERRNALIQTLEKLPTRPVMAVEVGTWCGLGSTETVMKHLPKGSILFCIDRWEYASLPSTNAERLMQRHASTARHIAKERIGQLRANFPHAQIEIIEASSEIGLSSFPDESVDFIYLDGSHGYKQLKLDIAFSLKVLHSDGILCGDDLEILPDRNVIDACSPHRERTLSSCPQAMEFILELSALLENYYWMELRLRTDTGALLLGDEFHCELQVSVFDAETSECKHVSS